jgi:hypothetical protein
LLQNINLVFSPIYLIIVVYYYLNKLYASITKNKIIIINQLEGVSEKLEIYYFRGIADFIYNNYIRNHKWSFGSVLGIRNYYDHSFNPCFPWQLLWDGQKVLLRLVRDQSVHLNDFKTGMAEWSGYVVAIIIYTFYRLIPMLLIVPLILFIIGSIIGGVTLWVVGLILTILALIGLSLLIWLSIKYIFIEYVAVENTSLSGFEILKKASAITKGNMIPLLGYSIVFG